jgi:hypothetical protein
MRRYEEPSVGGKQIIGRVGLGRAQYSPRKGFPNLDLGSSTQRQNLVSHVKNFSHEEGRLPRKVRADDVFLAH